MDETYTSPVFLFDKTKELNDSFYLILAEIIKTYPTTKSSPNDISNNAVHLTNRNMMKQLQSDYFLHKNTIVKEGERMATATIRIDASMNSLETENSINQSKLNSLIASDNSAAGILDDTKLSRNQLMIGNVLLFLIMAGGGYFYYKKSVV